MKKQEFEWQKKLIELEEKAKIDISAITHKNRMEEIEFEGKIKLSIEASKHEKEMERQRIRNADIQRNKMNRAY